MNSQSKQQVPGLDVARARDNEGFSRLELAAVLGALGLLALLALPSLANQRERSSRVLCVNNLRLAGQAIQQWGTEHGGRLPWRTPWCEGGTQVNAPCSRTLPPWGLPGLNNNAYFQWMWVSNELRSPKILACPADAQAKPASAWSGTSDGGFWNAAYQNRAVSYLIGLDVLPETPDGLVAGDRNVRFNQISISVCSSGINPVPGLIAGPIGSFGIGAGLHVEAGNYLFTDGRVEELSSQAFFVRWLKTSPGQDNGAAHYLVP